jgi:ribokinase
MPFPRFDVLGFGAVAVDDLLYVDEYPPAESKVRVRRRRRECGGLTGTALVAAARLGSRCAYVGLLGDDGLSRFVRRTFDREGIDARFAIVRPDARQAHSTIIVDESRHTRTVFASVDGAVGPDPELPAADLIRSARAILVDHHGVEGTIRAARIAREAGVPVVADFERDPGGRFAELPPLVDHLVLGERFAGQLAGRSDPAAAAAELFRRGTHAVVVTCGTAGCWYVDQSTGGVVRHCPAFAVETVDTTGCGDVFHGAYAAMLARGVPLRQRVVHASAVAALKATRRGGQSGCPSMPELREFLEGRDDRGH